eukprot:TRINITY_DN4292_c0_g1_i1.p1 TRINITY_DN4292_c0_g1~~TRINITY_DN4292_c0_g1_i1.p1  ORF type:complete len:215 (+),score=16.75 TRINITY_DN4292_c0_g1_i1:72-647(+)
METDAAVPLVTDGTDAAVPLVTDSVPLSSPWATSTLREVLLIVFYPLWLLISKCREAGPNPFFKILEGSLPATYYHQDDQCICIKNIHPVSDFHALVIPRKSVRDWRALTSDDLGLLRHMKSVAQKVAQEQKVQEPRYQFQTPPFNSVFQLHLHILSQPMKISSWSGEYATMNSSWAVTPDHVERCLLSAS